MRSRLSRGSALVGLLCLLTLLAGAQPAPPAAPSTPPAAPPALVLPLARTAYFCGERVPLALTNLPPDVPVTVEAVLGAGKTLLYRGTPGALLLDTQALVPGDYALTVDGAVLLPRLTLVSPLRKSVGSMQDEAAPREPDFTPQERKDPQAMAKKAAAHWDGITRTLKESGLTGVVNWAVIDMGRAGALDAMARAGTLMLVNPDTRPTSFFPVGNHPGELEAMSQRMILTAQANGRHPNFGGFCYGWDTTGHAVGGRLGLLIYWGWNDKTQALRTYLGRIDVQKQAEFTRRTGLQPVTDAEYIAYLLSLGRPELAPAIDLPTKRWLEEIARYTKPLSEAERVAFEKRLDAWSGYLMGLYAESYTAYNTNLKSVDPALRATSSVQVDHAPVRDGQYFPAAYQPLDFQYQSAWNDQVGGPDYLYQWLFVSGLLEMGRGDKPTWISSSMASAHGLSELPGKLTRVAAHNLAFGGTGVGYALEGFSNLLGGMNQHSNWEAIKGHGGEADVRAARDFLDRFAALAVQGRGEHGVGILFSKSQYGRQTIAMGYGTPAYKALVALTRLGYTPRFVTEEELAAKAVRDVQALVVIAQTVPLPAAVQAGLAAYQQTGGRIFLDGASSIAIAGAQPLGLTFPFTLPGKPHSWGAPNMVGENDTQLYARWHPDLAAGFAKALGDTGHALYRSGEGTAAKISLLQLDGGADAKYLVAVNDSHVKNQADWHQVVETLQPLRAVPATTQLYDCTEEKSLGAAGPIRCDLSATTARVYALLARPLAGIDLKATQTVRAGEALTVSVAFLDAGKKPLAAVLPFHLALHTPDGLYQEFYRATTRDGLFRLALPMPANAPVGAWTVTVRAQLSGQTATLPVKITPARKAAYAAALTAPVLVRERALIAATLTPGTTVVLPLFDSSQAAALLPVAERVKAVLATKGVAVEIRQKPVVTPYTLGYDPTAAQLADNARAERGETIGKIKRETVNANDWYSALSGYRFSQPVLLLDLAGAVDNPMAETLAGTGILWPQVSAAFPGPGRAVVQGVHWAFAPRTPALVIQAMDVAGLLAGAEALVKLPEDVLTPGIQATKALLWRELAIGGRPEMPAAKGVTAKGGQTGSAPQPFRLTFPGNKPLRAAEIVVAARPVPSATALPATFTPKQYHLQLKETNGYIPTATAEFLVPDLRFSDAIALLVDVKAPGKVKIVCEGDFRFSDKAPCWQAQWEAILGLHDQLIPKTRQPQRFDLLLDGKPLGTLAQVETGVQKITIALGHPQKTAEEEVAVRISGEITLPAGVHQLTFVKGNIVDGHLQKIYVGTEPGQ
jgi:hypothetical protein